MTDNECRKIAEACADKLEGVPDGFEIWFAKSANSKQPFIMWTYTSDASEGFVTMNKVSGNPAITD